MVPASTPRTADPGRQRAEPGTPLYVHLPFCAAKCPYCDFYSVVEDGRDVDGFLDALLAEARERAPRAPRTVFLGGGTPSALSVPQLRRLLDGLEELCGFRGAASEVTVECNPESLDGDKARALADLGATRLSIGFQSLRDEVLALFGRVHSAERSALAYEAARAVPGLRVSVDLIYGAPEQTVSEWKEDLVHVFSLEPDHVSAYGLTYEEGTPFRSWLREGRLVRQPEEIELELFLATREACSAAGYEPYELSNYSLSGQECRHNVNYWRNGPYVGLGPSAASHVSGTRSGNVRSVAAYTRWVGAGRDPLAWRERLDPLRRLGETWWLGLRLREGVDPAAARRTAGHPERDDPALERAAGLEAEGLLERAGRRFRLSARGLPLADRVGAAFLDLEPAVLRSAGRPAGML